MNNSLNNLFYNVNDYNLIKENSQVNTHSFEHGKQFKKYQNKMLKNKGKKKVSFFQPFKEGYSNISLEETNINKEAQAVLDNANYTLSSQNKNLVDEYNTVLSQYSTSLQNLTGIISNYFARIDSSNPYLGKNIRFPDSGAIFYVTQQGIAKYYNSGDDLNNTSGKNGCPASSWIELTIPWSSSYLNPGTVIPTNPSLIVGTPMIAGQSCGNEGKNIIVNKVLNNTDMSYQGCFADDDINHVMTFIGGAPAPDVVSNNLVVNGNFENPMINNNSFQFVGGYSVVNSWWFSAILLNNYKGAFPLPYPSGPQCAGILSNQGFSQNMVIPTSGDYVLTFFACNFSNANYNTANYVNIQFNSNVNGSTGEEQVGIQSAVNTMNNIVQTIQASPKWQMYNIMLSVPSPGVYTIGFLGSKFSNFVSYGQYQNVFSGDQDITGIQNVSIVNSSNINSSNLSGSFTFENCQEQAVLNGYKNFALQNVDPKTNLGYCAVSNNLIAASQLGKSNKYAPLRLWSFTSNVNQIGNTAILNYFGSLVLNTDNGILLFQTPAAQMSNYVGTYQDGCYSGRDNVRTMPAVNGSEGWDVKWNYDSCSQAAQQQGYQYFGLQYFQPNGLGQCTVSNDINTAREYGPATNGFPVNSEGVINGNSCSNSIYSTNNTQEPSFYWLALQDDGNMCIYRGTGPGDIQGGSAIWCSMTNDKQQEPNPNYVASRGKTGTNWMPSGTILTAGDFIGSTNGNIYLMMQADGNLVLNTSTYVTNCSKMSNGYYGGGESANAIYQMSETGDASLINNVYYVDPNSNIIQYNSENLGPGSNYSLFSNIDTPGNDLGETNSNIQQCEKTCNDDNNCGGFVFDSVNNICMPKTKLMWPYTKDMVSYNSNTSGSRNTYVKMNKLNNGSLNNSDKLINTDSASVMHYPNNSSRDVYELGNFVLQELNNLNNLENNINNLASQISNENLNMENSDSSIYQQAAKDKIAIMNFLKDFKFIKQEIENVDMKNHLLQDTDIKVLQENYTYLLWTILAIGIVIIGINVINKK
jgi:hypothetical protein